MLDEEGTGIPGQKSEDDGILDGTSALGDEEGKGIPGQKSEDDGMLGGTSAVNERKSNPCRRSLQKNTMPVNTHIPIGFGNQGPHFQL